MTSCGPFNFEGDKLHLKFLKKPQISVSKSIVIHITYYGKISDFLDFVAWPKWFWKNDKNRIFFGCPLYEGHVHMSIWPRKCGPIDFKYT